MDVWITSNSAPVASFIGIYNKFINQFLTWNRGTIADFDFHPMVELVDSILLITVFVPDLGDLVQLEHRDAIENLIRRFGFTIEKGPVWDLGDFKAGTRKKTRIPGSNY